MSLSTTIKSIQDIMRKDAGIDGDAQRIGQLGWMLFFKIFSDLEIESELEDDDYESPVPPHLRWNAWANEDLLGTDAPTGDDLLDLVDNSLFPVFKDLNVAHFGGKPRERAELLRSVFEDAGLLVINKPSGLAVHGGSGLKSTTAGCRGGSLT